MGKSISQKHFYSKEEKTHALISALIMPFVWDPADTVMKPDGGVNLNKKISPLTRKALELGDELQTINDLVRFIMGKK